MITMSIELVELPNRIIEVELGEPITTTTIEGIENLIFYLYDDDEERMTNDLDELIIIQ